MLAIKSSGVRMADNSSMQTQDMSLLKGLCFSVIKTGCALTTWHRLKISSILLPKCFSPFMAMLPTITYFSFGTFMMKSKGAFWMGEMSQKANFLKILLRSAGPAMACFAFMRRHWCCFRVFSRMFMGFATGMPKVFSKLYVDDTEAFAMPLS